MGIIYAAPYGNAGATGARADPYDLATALGLASTTTQVYLLAGTYPGTFTLNKIGNAANRVIVRNDPGALAIIDSSGAAPGIHAINIPVTAEYCDVFGIVCTDSDSLRIDPPGSFRPAGAQCEGQNCRLLCMVLHDNGNGILLPNDGHGSEVFGCLSLVNGYDLTSDMKGHGHGVYWQHDNGTASKLTGNVFAYPYAYGIHGYAESHNISDLDARGNVTVGCGRSSSFPNFWRPGVLLGALLQRCDDVILRRHRHWAAVNSITAMKVGWDAPNGGGNDNNDFDDCYLVGKVTLPSAPGDYSAITFDGMTVVSKPPQALGQAPTYLTDPPNTFVDYADTGTKIFIEDISTVYEANRILVTIYNWDELATVEVDLSAYLVSGSAAYIFNAMNPLGGAVGVSNSGHTAVSFDMDATDPKPPLGGSIGAPYLPGRKFGVFVVRQNDVSDWGVAVDSAGIATARRTGRMRMADVRATRGR